jgi:hypothetical protein
MLQLPAIYTKPLSDDFPTDGDLLIELSDVAWKSVENPEGLQLDEWQKWLLRHVLERYPADYPEPRTSRATALQAGCCISRQTEREEFTRSNARALGFASSSEERSSGALACKL